MSVLGLPAEGQLTCDAWTGWCSCAHAFLARVPPPE